MTMRRMFLLVLFLMVLVYCAIRFDGCDQALAQRGYNPGDTVKVALARSDTLLNGTDEVSGESLTVWRWLGITPTNMGTFTEVACADSGVAGFYWIVPDSTDIGEYFASWSGTIQTRTPAMTWNFYVEGPPSGPNKVNLWFLDDSDSSGIADVWVRIKDEDQVDTQEIRRSSSSGLVTTALPADTFQVIASKQGAYTFTVPEQIINTTSGLTDTIFGTAFDPGTPDSSNVTRIYGWCRDLTGTAMPDVILTVTRVGTYTDWGSPGTSPTLIVFGSPVRDTTDSNGKFSIDLVCADQILPEGGSTGNVRHIFEFSSDTWVDGFFVAEDDTLYIPCTNQSYGYWNSALRP